VPPTPLKTGITFRAGRATIDQVAYQRYRALCHGERAQILSERSESKDRHPLASRDLHLPSGER